MDTESKETILFVDDEESILDVAYEYFTEKGYRVITAENGSEAVQILENEKIDCCFSDINMPEMDGLQLAEYIRNKDNTIPIIIMTGFPSLDNTIRTLKNGVVDFLIKPVNLGQMELCVRRVLRERRLFIENILLKEEVERKARLEKINLELTQKVEELNTLNEIMSHLNSVGSSFDVFKFLVDMTLQITHADESRFYIINTEVLKPFQLALSTKSSESQSPGSALENEDDRNLESLIMDVASSELPLLIPARSKSLPAHTRSFMAVPLKIRKKTFGVLTASSMHPDIPFNEKSLYYMTFMTSSAAYAIENHALYENIYVNLFQALYAFVKAIEAKDPYTQKHSERVTEIAITIARDMNCSNEDIEILEVAGRLHDIGKIGIQDKILLKPGRLSAEEFETIKSHPVIGAEIVGHLGLWDKEQQIIRYHHERYDGAGYPEGLKKEQIPYLARILSVADVYDAIASDRTYRLKMEEEKILRIIAEGSGTQFDPQIVERFNMLYQKGAIPQVNSI